MQELIVKPKKKVIIKKILKGALFLVFGLLCLFPVVVFWRPGAQVTADQRLLATIIVAPLGLLSIYLGIVVILSILTKKIILTDDGILVTNFFLFIKEKINMQWNTMKEVVYRTVTPNTTYSIIRLEFKEDNEWGEIELGDFDQEQKNLLRERITMKAKEKGITTSELKDEIDLDELYLEMEEEEVETPTHAKYNDERTTIE